MKNMKLKLSLLLLTLLSSTSSFAMSCVATTSYTAAVWKYEKGICEGGYTYKVKGLAVGLAFDGKSGLSIKCSSPVIEGTYYGGGIEIGLAFGYTGLIFDRQPTPYLHEVCALGKLMEHDIKASVDLFTQLTIFPPTEASRLEAKKYGW